MLLPPHLHAAARSLSSLMPAQQVSTCEQHAVCCFSEWAATSSGELVPQYALQSKLRRRACTGCFRHATNCALCRPPVAAQMLVGRTCDSLCCTAIAMCPAPDHTHTHALCGQALVHLASHSAVITVCTAQSRRMLSPLTVLQGAQRTARMESRRLPSRVLCGGTLRTSTGTP